MCKPKVAADLEVLVPRVEGHIALDLPPTYVSYEGSCGGRGCSRRGFAGASQKMHSMLIMSG
jgi:hypothetical protein